LSRLGQFQLSPWPANAVLYYGDVNADFATDLYVLDPSTNRLNVYPATNSGSGPGFQNTPSTFVQLVADGGNVPPVRVIDVNRDGHADVVEMLHNGDYRLWLANRFTSQYVNWTGALSTGHGDPNQGAFGVFDPNNFQGYVDVAQVGVSGDGLSATAYFWKFTTDSDNFVRTSNIAFPAPPSGTTYVSGSQRVANFVVTGLDDIALAAVGPSATSLSLMSPFENRVYSNYVQGFGSVPELAVSTNSVWALTMQITPDRRVFTWPGGFSPAPRALNPYMFQMSDSGTKNAFLELSNANDIASIGSTLVTVYQGVQVTTSNLGTQSYFANDIYAFYPTSAAITQHAVIQAKTWTGTPQFPPTTGHNELALFEPSVGTLEIVGRSDH
jgi:hypothetical protein